MAPLRQLSLRLVLGVFESASVAVSIFVVPPLSPQPPFHPHRGGKGEPHLSTRAGNGNIGNGPRHGLSGNSSGCEFRAPGAVWRKWPEIFGRPKTVSGARNSHPELLTRQQQRGSFPIFPLPDGQRQNPGPPFPPRRGWKGGWGDRGGNKPSSNASSATLTNVVNAFPHTPGQQVRPAPSTRPRTP